MAKPTEGKRSAATPKRGAYPGDLNTPISTGSWPDIDIDIDFAVTLSAVERQRFYQDEVARVSKLRQDKLDLLLQAKLALLLKHFKIDSRKPDRWRRLALQLADRHVEGFRVISEPPPKRGRPWKGRHTFYEMFLVDDIDKIVDERGVSVASAARIANRKSSLYRKYSWRTLERRYYELLG